MTEEKEFSKGTGLTAEDVKAMVEARAQAALEEAQARPLPEVAEPWLWWNLFSVGPWQEFAPYPPGPLPPHQVIKVGDTAFVATVLWINTFPILPPPPGISPCAILTGFGAQYEITYQTCNLTTCSLGAPNAVHTGPLDACVIVDVLEWMAATEGMFSMNISARLTADPPTPPHPPFAGFARWVYDLDPELFLPDPTPGWQYDFPLKFLVYP